MALATLIPLTGISPAAADQISDKKAQAAQMARDLQAKGERVSVLAEQVDQARLKADSVNAQLAKAQADMAATDAKAAAVTAALRDQAIDSYVRAGTQTTVRTSGVDPAVEHAYVAALSSNQTDALDQMRQVRLQLNEQQAQLNTAKKAANDSLAAVRNAQKAAEKAVADNQAALGKVKGELSALVAEEQARQEREAAAKAQAALAARMARPAADRSSRSAAPPAAEAPVSPGASGAVEEARRQLGKPYRYGAAGPDSFDCSGLTMWAWGHAGVSLPHSSQAQWSSTRHIPLSDLQPGDLVFFGSDIHHEGIYVGGGTMIEAPHTGLNVRYASIYRSDLVGATRPG